MKQTNNSSLSGLYQWVLCGVPASRELQESSRERTRDATTVLGGVNAEVLSDWSCSSELEVCALANPVKLHFHWQSPVKHDTEVSDRIWKQNVILPNHERLTVAWEFRRINKTRASVLSSFKCSLLCRPNAHGLTSETQCVNGSENIIYVIPCFRLEWR